jgi:flagellar biosynthesis protein FlhG
MSAAISHTEKSSHSFLSEVLASPFFTELFQEKKPNAESNGKDAANPKSTQCLWLLSGKGGVGKSFIATSLAHELSKSGFRVLLVDTTTLQGSIHFFPYWEKIHIQHDQYGLELSFRQSTITDASGVRIVHCNPLEFLQENEEVDQFLKEFDVVLIDSDKGFPIARKSSWKFKKFVIVLTPDPASIVNSWAVMKHTYLNTTTNPIGVIINQVDSPPEGEEIFKALNQVAQKYLSQPIDFYGSVNCNVGSWPQKLY